MCAKRFYLVYALYSMHIYMYMYKSKVSFTTLFVFYHSCPEVPEPTMRLMGGKSPNEGRVEVSISGGRRVVVYFHYFPYWGRVCDTTWDINDANVACRQLGYVRAMIATGRGAFGNGTAEHRVSGLV